MGGRSYRLLRPCRVYSRTAGVVRMTLGQDRVAGQINRLWIFASFNTGNGNLASTLVVCVGIFTDLTDMISRRCSYTQLRQLPLPTEVVTWLCRRGHDDVTCDDVTFDNVTFESVISRKYCVHNISEACIPYFLYAPITFATQQLIIYSLIQVYVVYFYTPSIDEKLSTTANSILVTRRRHWHVDLPL